MPRLPCSPSLKYSGHWCLFLLDFRGYQTPQGPTLPHCPWALQGDARPGWGRAALELALAQKRFCPCGLPAAALGAVEGGDVQLGGPEVPLLGSDSDAPSQEPPLTTCY